MSFDIFVKGIRGGVSSRVDREAFLAGLGPNLTHREKYFYLETTNGGLADVYGMEGDPFDGCMFAVHRDLTTMLADAMVSAASAARCAIYWPSKDWLIAYPHADMLDDMPTNPEAPKPVYCATGAELKLLIQSGLDAWKRYRDQVVRPTQE